MKNMFQACVKRLCKNMIEKGIDALCSEDEMSDNENEAEVEPKTPASTSKALLEKLKGQSGIKDCFIPIMKLDVDGSVMMKHLGFKWVGDSIGSVKDKIYYSQVRTVDLSVLNKC